MKFGEPGSVTSWLKKQWSPKELLVTALQKPSEQDLQRAYQLYHQDTKGFPGEMTQKQLNHYLGLIRGGYR